MRKKALFPMMMTAAALACFSATAPTAGFAAPVNVQVTAYLPTPPGVGVYLGAAAPMYPESERMVYVERERRYKEKRRHKHKNWEHEERGRKNGHYK